MKKIICPACGSSNIYFRIGTHDFQCRHCGSTFPKED